MNLRWLLFDYADPDLPLSFWKRQKLIWRHIPVWKMPQPLRRGRLICGILIAVPLLPAPVFSAYLSQLFGNMSHWGVLFLTVFLFTVMSWTWGCFVYGLTSRAEHYYRIRLEGFDVCLGCGYWLRGLDETIKTCPECGTERLAFDEDKQTKAES